MTHHPRRPGRREHGHSVAEIAAMLGERADTLARDLLPGGRRNGNEWKAGSVRGEAGGSLSVCIRGAKRGVWSDFATGEAGDMLDLVAAVHGTDKAGALTWARQWLGLGQSQEPAPMRRQAPLAAEKGPGRDNPDRDEIERVEAAIATFLDAAPAPGTGAEAYLRGRGIRCPIPESIRFAAALRHRPSGRTLPAMVAAVQVWRPERAKYVVCGAHRTFLRRTTGDDGTDFWTKADVEPVKMMLGRCAGGAVRLSADGGSLVVTEGIETGLSVLQAVLAGDHRVADDTLGISVWAALSTSGMRSVVVPERFDHLTLAPDGDQAGQAAAEAAAARLARERPNLDIRIARPPAGADFNDLLRGER